MKHSSTKGFTLVEIMIVVVIIGLLAAMAIPAFQKVRTGSITKTVVNDARQIAAAAQQYMMENGVTTVALTVATADGAVTGPLGEYVKTVGKGGTWPGQLSVDANFTVAHPQADFDPSSAVSTVGTFTPEGQPAP